MSLRVSLLTGLNYVFIYALFFYWDLNMYTISQTLIKKNKYISCIFAA